MRSDREREARLALERMAVVLETGRWPSGVPVTPAERRVIIANAERLQRDLPSRRDA